MSHSPRTVLLALAAVLLLAAPAAAAPRATTINLPKGLQAEAMTAADGVLYTGGFYDGSVWRVNPRTGKARVFVKSQDGRNSMGIAFKGKRMLVAGGLTGNVYIYDRATGRNIRTVALGGALVNDITVIGDTAYATDTLKPVFYAIPLKAGEQPRTMNLKGVPYDANGVNADGILAAKGRLILNHYGSGTLWNVDPKTGDATQIDVGGEKFPGADGMILRGRELLLVQNQNQDEKFSGALNRILLKRNLRAGKLMSTETGAAYGNPVDVAESAGDLFILNTPTLQPQDPTAVSYLLRR